MPDVTWYWPKGGIDRLMGFSAQKPHTMDDGSYAASVRDAVNVQTFDPATTRDRGCSRPGLRKYKPLQVSGTTWVVQELTTLVTVGDMQNSQSGRVVYLVAVSQGNVYTAIPGDDFWTEVSNGTGEDPPLNITGLVYSTSLNQMTWFVDGINYVTFDPANNALNLWTATDGEMPADADGNYARLICTWRGRIILSGIVGDPANWFMSAVGEPTNFNYAGTVNADGDISVTPTQAVAGNNSSLGLIGDVVTCLIPYSDDVLIFGGDHTIYMMRGDPMAGGQIDLISDSIGMAFGMPWCKDPYGTVYFFSNRCGIYSLVPGQLPQRISLAIDQLLVGVDTGTNGIRMAWDDRYQGLRVWITPLVAPSLSTHLLYETRTQAWWKFRYGSKYQDPLCVTVFDGNDPQDRVTLLGTWSGYVYAVDPDAVKDDLFPIVGYIVFGPIVTQNLDDMLLLDMQAVLGETSSEGVVWEVFVGETAEAALDGPPVASGTWGPGRNPLAYIRRSGHAIYVKVSFDSPMAFENLRLTIDTEGRVRMRGSSV